MDTCRIEWKRSAVKELKQLPKEMLARILQTVEPLAVNPFPAGAKKLAGS